ncbi:hypothetical protein Tco_0494673, partial [Tanacetum coccineum]
GIRKVGYGIRDTWMDPAEAVLEIAPMTLGEETVLIVEDEAYASREAWAYSIGLSQAVHHELQAHCDHVHETRSQMQQAEMEKLRETDHRRQAQMVETLRVMRDMRQIMAPVTRRGPNTPPKNPNPNNMTSESVQAMINQALL